MFLHDIPARGILQTIVFNFFCLFICHFSSLRFFSRSAGFTGLVTEDSNNWSYSVKLQYNFQFPIFNIQFWRKLQGVNFSKYYYLMDLMASSVRTKNSPKDMNLRLGSYFVGLFCIISFIKRFTIVSLIDIKYMFPKIIGRCSWYLGVHY